MALLQTAGLSGSDAALVAELFARYDSFTLLTRTAHAPGGEPIPERGITLITHGEQLLMLSSSKAGTDERVDVQLLPALELPDLLAQL